MQWPCAIGNVKTLEKLMLIHYYHGHNLAHHTMRKNLSRQRLTVDDPMLIQGNANEKRENWSTTISKHLLAFTDAIGFSKIQTEAFHWLGSFHKNTFVRAMELWFYFSTFLAL